VGTDDIEEPLTSFEAAQTARYDLNWLQKYRLDKKVATLFVMRGVDTGLRIPLTKETVTLGRTVEADLVFHDEQISRRHAMIRSDSTGESYTLSDLGSTNGTYLNDRPVTKPEPLKDGDKIFIGTTILKFQLQDELEVESGELVDRLMFQDDLTGLVVKRRFYNQLRTQLQAAGAQGLALSVLMMDLDGLKKVNDNHGHPVGAFIISEAGRLIGEIVTAKGQACRYGGDEFIAYLDAQKQETVEVAEAIRRAIGGHAFAKDGIEHRVTISIGVATFPDDGKSLEAMTKAADEALYRAKHKGRDVVSV
jgi:diguanylate cyclase (GGDEF)-like protein